MKGKLLAILIILNLFLISECKKKRRWKKRLSEKPHIVFVLADDFGFNDIGYHGMRFGSHMYTPFLDNLAARGVKLENYYVQPICSPTRGQLLSGRYQIHTGLVHGVIKSTQAYGLPLDNILLPEQLRQCGYKTHMIGKWHLGFYKNEYLPWNRGFHTFYGFLGGGENHYTRYRCEPKKVRKYCGIDFIDSKSGPTNKTRGVYSTRLFLEKPLFLYLALQAVHAPLQVPRRFQRRFRSIPDRNRRLYGGMVFAMDKALRRLSLYLKHEGMWKDTIFIFSTDNGGQTTAGGNNWPLRGNKGTLWEGGVKAVGFVHGKRLRLKKSGITNEQLLHVSDWFPTIMSAAECSILNGTQKLDGYDQWQTIRANMQTKRTEILHNIDPLFKKSKEPEIRSGFDVSVRAAIRSGKWKLLTGKVDQGLDDWVRPPECNSCTNIADLNEEMRARKVTSNIKLFNIQQDPYEKHELSAEYPEVVDLLLSRMVEYNASAVPPVYPPHNRLCNPQHHEGFWLPWKNKKFNRRTRFKANKRLKQHKLAIKRRHRYHRRRKPRLIVQLQK